eukprot:gene18347-24812_t
MSAFNQAQILRSQTALQDDAVTLSTGLQELEEFKRLRDEEIRNLSQVLGGLNQRLQLAVPSKDREWRGSLPASNLLSSEHVTGMTPESIQTDGAQTISSEEASLLRVLQESAHQRALAESVLSKSQGENEDSVPISWSSLWCAEDSDTLCSPPQQQLRTNSVNNTDSPKTPPSKPSEQQPRTHSISNTDRPDNPLSRPSEQQPRTHSFSNTDSPDNPLSKPSEQQPRTHSFSNTDRPDNPLPKPSEQQPRTHSFSNTDRPDNPLPKPSEQQPRTHSFSNTDRPDNPLSRPSEQQPRTHSFYTTAGPNGPPSKPSPAASGEQHAGDELDTRTLDQSPSFKAVSAGGYSTPTRGRTKAPDDLTGVARIRTWTEKDEVEAAVAFAREELERLNVQLRQKSARLLREEPLYPDEALSPSRARRVRRRTKRHTIRKSISCGSLMAACKALSEVSTNHASPTQPLTATFPGLGLSTHHASATLPSTAPIPGQVPRAAGNGQPVAEHLPKHDGLHPTLSPGHVPTEAENAQPGSEQQRGRLSKHGDLPQPAFAPPQDELLSRVPPGPESGPQPGPGSKEVVLRQTQEEAPRGEAGRDSGGSSGVSSCKESREQAESGCAGSSGVSSCGESREKGERSCPAANVGAARQKSSDTSEFKCQVCHLLQDQMAALQEQIRAVQQESAKASSLLEQERFTSLSKEAELATCRQQLRNSIKRGRSGGSESGSTGPTSANGSTAVRRALPVSGWEDLIDEASADLEQLEGHVCNVARRLINLQSQASTAAGEAAVAEQRRLEAELQDKSVTVKLKSQACTATCKAAVAEQRCLEAELQELSVAVKLKSQASSAAGEAAVAEQRCLDAELQEKSVTENLKETSRLLKSTSADVRKQQQLLSDLEGSISEAKQSMAALQKQRSTSELECRSRAAQLSATETDVHRAEQRLIQLRHERDTVECGCAETKHTLQLLKSEMEAVESSMSKTQTAISEAEHKLCSTTNSHDAVRLQLESARQELDGLKRERGLLSSEKKEAVLELQRVHTELDSLHQKVSETELKYDGMRETISRSKKERDGISEDIEQSAKQRDELAKEISSATEQRDEIQLQIEHEQESLKVIQQEIADLQDKSKTYRLEQVPLQRASNQADGMLQADSRSSYHSVSAGGPSHGQSSFHLAHLDLEKLRAEARMKPGPLKLSKPTSSYKLSLHL